MRRRRLGAAAALVRLAVAAALVRAAAAKAEVRYDAKYVPYAADASPRAARRAREVFFTVAAATDAEEAALLPFWLAHATAAGITGENLIIVLHAPHETAYYKAMASTLEAAGALGHVRWSSGYSGPAKEAVRRGVAFARFRQRGLLRDGDWIFHADSDEVAVFEAPLLEVLKRADAAGADVVGGLWTDRVAERGVLAPIPRNASSGTAALFAAFPLDCAFRRKPKVVAYRLPRAVTDGAHEPLGDGAKYAPDRAVVYHFKWRASVLQRLRERAKIKRGMKRHSAAKLVDTLVARLERDGGVCVGCDDMKGVCCRGCDVATLRALPDFIKPKM
mmetsp:Transcript_21343/g.63844  ORF Transcript_21343/g.63844 Transcript_21343/m.63844 type:complete len:333 (+) Transcript_21343:992-1990(+)